jgi:hypothetical protein
VAHSLSQSDEPGRASPSEVQQSFARNAEKVSSSLAIDELFMREAHRKLHRNILNMKLIQNGFCKERLIFHGTRYAMYISILEPSTAIPAATRS